MPASRVRLETAAGTAEGALGTDAMAIVEAVGRADDGEGVVVLMDLGSAVMSAQTAVEFLDPEVAERTRLLAAPLVEGLFAAYSAATDRGFIIESPYHRSGWVPQILEPPAEAAQARRGPLRTPSGAGGGTRAPERKGNGS